MRKTRMIILVEMCASIFLAAVVAILFECGMIVPGALSPNTQCVFVLTTVMQLLTIGSIPLALYLFRIPYIHRQLTANASNASSALLRWGSVRMLLLCVPMIVNVILYYLTSMTVSFAYLAVILAVSLAFIYPSEQRCAFETTEENCR